jgi:hypothetical protein
VGLFGVVTVWAMLRHIETGENRYLYWLTIATAFHFTSKETSFIYTAQAMLFLAGYLVYRLIQRPWPQPDWRRYFIVAIIAALVCLSVGGMLLYASRGEEATDAAETLAPAVPGEEGAGVTSTVSPAVSPFVASIPGIFIILALIALLAAAYFVLRGYT